jgi:hypothetical protein
MRSVPDTNTITQKTVESNGAAGERESEKTGRGR